MNAFTCQQQPLQHNTTQQYTMLTGHQGTPNLR